QKIGFLRDCVREVRGKVGGAQLRPALVYGLRPGDQLIDGNREVVEGISPIGIIWMNVGDCPYLRPGHGCGDRGGGAVRRLDVGDPEDVVGIRDRLVEEEVRAAIHEAGEELKFFGNRTWSRRVSTRGDAGEQVNVLGELQPS